MKVIIAVHEYPQISQTYVKHEIDAISAHHEIEIVAVNPGNTPYRDRRPHVLITQGNQKQVVHYLKSFAADIIHGHYLTECETYAALSTILNIPFTVRSHSFDVLGLPDQRITELAAIINRDNCLGLLAFPFLRDSLEKCGVKPHKIVDCFPVVNYSLFKNTTANGSAIMNVGVAGPKKNMEAFVKLSRLMPHKKFNLYALGEKVDDIKTANIALGGRVNVVEPIEPCDMPAHYKQHQWLVYTASKDANTVGWPMAIAEAQASGVGVCMQAIRPDLKEFVGDAGFLYSDVDEIIDVISKPFPEDLRARGFELAKRSDIATHLHLLTDCWKNA